MLVEPLSPPAARALLRQIIDGGITRFSRHARVEMSADGLSADEVQQVVRSGIVEPAELEGGSWRYRVRVGRVVVVVAFRSEVEIVVVTAWRMK